MASPLLKVGPALPLLGGAGAFDLKWIADVDDGWGEEVAMVDVPAKKNHPIFRRRNLAGHLLLIGLALSMQTCADHDLLNIEKPERRGTQHRDDRLSEERTPSPLASADPRTTVDPNSTNTPLPKSDDETAEEPISYDRSDEPLRPSPELGTIRPTTTPPAPESSTVPEPAMPVTFPTIPASYARILPALTQSVEVKGISLFENTWNVQKVTVSATRNSLTVTGQISHHRTLYFDHQMRYVLTIKDQAIVSATLYDIGEGRSIDNGRILAIVNQFENKLPYEVLPSIYSYIYDINSIERWEDGAQIIALFIGLKAYQSHVETLTP